MTFPPVMGQVRVDMPSSNVSAYWFATQASLKNGCHAEFCMLAELCLHLAGARNTVALQRFRNK